MKSLFQLISLKIDVDGFQANQKRTHTMLPKTYDKHPTNINSQYWYHAIRLTLLNEIPISEL